MRSRTRGAGERVRGPGWRLRFRAGDDQVGVLRLGLRQRGGGDARGCHLHVELWSGPGWYTGGAPVDPQAALRLWDAYS